MLTIQTTEAKAHLAELLRTVERGETVAITRHGKAIAHLIPAPEDRAARYQEFMAAFCDLRKEWKKWKPSDLSVEQIVRLCRKGHRM